MVKPVVNIVARVSLHIFFDIREFINFCVLQFIRVRMYLLNRYSAEFYGKLIGSVDAVESAERNSISFEEKRKLLILLGVKRIRLGIRKNSDVSLSSRRILPSDVKRAFRRVVLEADEYLRKYREVFISDFDSGKLEGLIGEQRKFEFS